MREFGALIAQNTPGVRCPGRARDLHRIEIIVGRYITGRTFFLDRKLPAMPPRSPAPVDRILDYTSIAANALHNIATASQIPFLGRICTLTLKIIPMVQVCNSCIFVSCW
jgi:hypothetical protein